MWIRRPCVSAYSIYPAYTRQWYIALKSHRNIVCPLFFMIYDILTLIFCSYILCFPDFMRFVHNYAEISYLYSFSLSISGKTPLKILLPLSCRLIKFCFRIFHSKNPSTRFLFILICSAHKNGKGWCLCRTYSPYLYQSLNCFSSFCRKLSFPLLRLPQFPWWL